MEPTSSQSQGGPSGMRPPSWSTAAVERPRLWSTSRQPYGLMDALVLKTPPDGNMGAVAAGLSASRGLLCRERARDAAAQLVAAVC